MKKYINEIELKEYNDYYTKRYKDYGIDVKSVGWSSEYGQEVRFEILCDHVSKGDSVLDIGSGFGDLYNFLQENNITSDYLGIDLNKEYTQISQNKYPTANFKNTEIFSVTGSFDWVIASGIFCFDIEKYDEYLESTLTHMFKLCNKGVAINFLSDYTSLEKVKPMKYINPADIINIITNISKKFIIRHDYKTNDFTTFILK